MIDLETGEVTLYKCMRCEKAGKTLFQEQLYYKFLPNAFAHLRERHALGQPEIELGTVKLWTHYLREINYTIPEDELIELRKNKQELEERKREIYNRAAKKEDPSIIIFPPSLSLSHGSDSDRTTYRHRRIRSRPRER